MSSEAVPSAPSVEWIAAQIKEANTLRDADPEKAVEILSQATEKGVAAYGEGAPQLAQLYLVYGTYLFELAQHNSTALGPRGQRATAQQEPEGPSAAGGAEQEGGEEAAAEEAAAEGAAAEGGEDAEEEEEEEEEEGEDDDDLDDMQLALGIMFAARESYRGMGTEQQYANELAEIQVVIGSILTEQEEFEEAVKELEVALALLRAMPQTRTLRRQGEAHFKLMLANHFMEQNEEALQHCQAAMKALKEEMECVEADANQAAQAGGEDAATKIASCSASLADLQQTLPEMQHWELELEDAVKQKKALKQALKAMAMQMVAGMPTPQGMSAGASTSGASTSAAAFSAASRAEPVKERQPVQDLGVVGRGKKRLELKPSAAPPSATAAGTTAPSSTPASTAFATASATASAELAGTSKPSAAPSKKRDLEAMMGGAAASEGFGRPSSNGLKK